MVEAIWKEVRSELEIDHGVDSVIVGGSPPEMMVNARVRGHMGSGLYLTSGPLATLEEARSEALNIAGEFAIKVIYRVMPIQSSRPPQSD